MDDYESRFHIDKVDCGREPGLPSAPETVINRVMVPPMYLGGRKRRPGGKGSPVEVRGMQTKTSLLSLKELNRTKNVNV